MNNPIMRLCEAIYKSDLPNKSDLMNEFNYSVNCFDEYFDTVLQEQWYYSTTPKEEQRKYDLYGTDERRRFAHDDCVSACAHLNDICSQLGIENICDFDTSDRRKVAEFAGYIICMFYFTNINTNEPMTDWLDKCPYEKHLPNENTTVSDTEVLDAATKHMDRFDEAFKELAK